VNEEIVSFSYCIFDACNKLIADLQKVLLSETTKTPVSNLKQPLTKEGKVPGTADAGYLGDIIYGRHPDDISACAVNYNDKDTETDYIMGFTLDIKNKIRTDQENKDDAEKAKNKAARFRFKEYSTHKNGFMIKLGGKNQFVLSKNKVDTDRCYEKATNRMMRL
jgi:hypothetical protein